MKGNVKHAIALRFGAQLFRKLTLKSLRVFDQVSEHGSTIKAAEALSLTQSAVTKSIQTLEESLGIELFIRTNHGMIPTEYAGILKQRVKLLLADFRDLANDTNSFLMGDSGQVAVGTLISASLRLLPLSISLLEKSAPRISISVEEGTVEQLFPLLITGDLAVIVGRVSYSPYSPYPWMRDGLISAEALLDEVLCLVTGNQHPLVNEKNVSLKELCAYRWILPSTPSPTRGLVEKMFVDAGIDFPRHATESLSLLSNLGLLLNSEAIGVLSSTSALEFRRLGLLHILPMKQEIVYGKIGFSTHANRALTPAAKRFVDSLREAASVVRRDNEPF